MQTFYKLTSLSLGWLHIHVHWCGQASADKCPQTLDPEACRPLLLEKYWQFGRAQKPLYEKLQEVVEFGLVLEMVAAGAPQL